MVEEVLKPTVIPLSGKLVTSKDPMTLKQGDFTDLTNMRYKRRNPISIIGMTKFNTATVVDGTASPGTYMKTRQGFHFKKDTPTDMGRDASHDDDEPDDPSDLFPELIGWYKVDEGSGTTLFNSANPTDPADKLPDLTITTANIGYFWNNLSGFGSGIAIEGPPISGTAASYNNATSFYATTVNDSIACFWRMDGLDPGEYPFLFQLTTGAQFKQEAELSIATYGSLSRVGVLCFMNGETHGAFTAAAPTITYPIHSFRWMFTFSITENGLWKIKTVLDDGTLITGAQTNAIGTQIPRDITWVRLFYGYDASNAEYAYFYGQVADAMYWTQKQLTIAEYAQVYDMLRARYGMAARSGWG